MGLNSQGTRLGQNSGIGTPRRSTRSHNSGSTASQNLPVLASPASTVSSRRPSSARGRPELVFAASTSSRRSITPSRTPRKHRRLSTSHPELVEEAILDEIVVRTGDREGFDDMNEESEMVTAPGQPCRSEDVAAKARVQPAPEGAAFTEQTWKPASVNYETEPADTDAVDGIVSEPRASSGDRETFVNEDNVLTASNLTETTPQGTAPLESLHPGLKGLGRCDTSAPEAISATQTYEDGVLGDAAPAEKVPTNSLPSREIFTGAIPMEVTPPEPEPVNLASAAPDLAVSEPFEVESIFPLAHDTRASQEPIQFLEDTTHADNEHDYQKVAAFEPKSSKPAPPILAEKAIGVESMDLEADDFKIHNTQRAAETVKQALEEASEMRELSNSLPADTISPTAGFYESNQSSPESVDQAIGSDRPSPGPTEQNTPNEHTSLNEITVSAHVDNTEPQASQHPLPTITTPANAATPDSRESKALSPQPIESTPPDSFLIRTVAKTESTQKPRSTVSQADVMPTSSIDHSHLDAAASTEAADELPGAMDDHVDDASSELSEAVSTDIIPTEATHPSLTPAKSAISHLIGESRNSFASSASALTERSGLSSKPASISSKATTPLDTGSPRETSSHTGPFPTVISTTQSRSAPRIRFDVRPRVSVPTDLTPQEYAVECIEATENSRLNPYALHQEEYLMLRYHISHAQVTTYLNIRNGILRLWVRNPQIAVTRQEAIGCAKDTRWFDVANVCFDWLVRRGFINYGCVEIRQQKRRNSVNEDSQPRKRRTVVVIGAGFSGLGCARQLEGLFTQYSKRFRDMGEDPPRVVVLEGRNRVGGRVYSRAFQTLPDTAPGIFRGRRFTAEMGGMIITGFDRGNPLNILVRGQLGLPYHCLRSDMSLYDTNGTAVDPVRDEMVEHLFNACLDRVSEYKFKSPPSKLIEGNHDLVDEGRDSTAEGHKTIALEEEKVAAQPHAPPVSQQNVAPETHLVPVSTDRMTGKVHVKPGTPGSTRAAFKARSIGWTLKAGVAETRDVDLDTAAIDSNATLGSVVDEALMQHKEILDLNAQDFRLLNWHIANLEYSNATNLNRLSLQGWDIDAGNEWEGKHTMVVGGYQSVARGLAMLPGPLDIRHRAPVKRITYNTEGSNTPAKIDLEDGQSIEADYVVNTIPLGVLKHGSIDFQPPLPPWKTEAISRLGFGVLNKVILVYKEAFWDKDRDIFGMLQTPTNRLSLNQKDYTSRRGRFFQWFNVTNTTGMPCLLALMAGDAGYDTEITPNDELVAEATEILRMRYGARVPSQPLEAIVTRWESDRFARGSYSNAGVEMQAEDYQIMAKSLGNLHFAGEHTIVTHPATVHGAYLSGLRAASDVIDSMLGPIEVPVPLVLPRETSASLKRKAQEENKDPAQARLEAYEMEVQEHIFSKIGYYPMKPGKVAGNPYLLFNKANYEEGRKRCEEGRRAGKGKPSPNEVRTMTSKMWKEASAEVRKPFEDAAEEQKRGYAQALNDWTEAAAKWEREALELRERYVKERPSVPTPEEASASATGGYTSGGRRAKKRVATYAEEDSDVDME